MTEKPQEDSLTEAEIAERLNRGLRRSLTMPPKPHEPKRPDTAQSGDELTSVGQ